VAVIHGRVVEGSVFCWASNITETKFNILFIAITNFVLLLLMLTGLLRRNNREKGGILHVLSAQVSLFWMYLRASVLGLMTDHRVCHGLLS